MSVKKRCLLFGASVKRRHHCILVRNRELQLSPVTPYPQIFSYGPGSCLHLQLKAIDTLLHCSKSKMSSLENCSDLVMEKHFRKPLQMLCLCLHVKREEALNWKRSRCLGYTKQPILRNIRCQPLSSF